MSFRILVVEDDSSIANLIATTLQIKFSNVTVLHDGEEAYHFIHERSFDLALLDIMLPNKDGYELLSELKNMHVPTILISAKTTLSDKVFGLNLGAEDYITKPFEPLELLARVDAALRRIQPVSEQLSVFDVTLNTDSRTVMKVGVPIELTKLEYDLLEFLLRNPNMVFSREKILDKVWGYEYMGGTRTVDMHIKNLRSKLGLEEYIRTVHKIGYRLVGKAE